MTALTDRSSPGRADWQRELPRLSLLALVGLLTVWILIALAGGVGIGAGEDTRQTLASVSLVAALVAAVGLLPWALGVSAMTWLRALFMVVGGISGVIAWRASESWPGQAAGVLIVAVGIATACAAMYYEGDEG
jgi:hypothetical protein